MGEGRGRSHLIIRITKASAVRSRFAKERNIVPLYAFLSNRISSPAQVKSLRNMFNTSHSRFCESAKIFIYSSIVIIVSSTPNDHRPRVLPSASVGYICARTRCQKWFCQHQAECGRAGHVLFLIHILLFLLFFFLRHYPMIPQFLLTLACFLACLAIEIINPVFSSSLHLSLVSLFLSLAVLRTLSICKNFRYIVNCYSVVVGCCCCQTTLGTDECTSNLCSNNDDDTVPSLQWLLPSWRSDWPGMHRYAA